MPWPQATDETKGRSCDLWKHLRRSTGREHGAIHPIGNDFDTLRRHAVVHEFGLECLAHGHDNPRIGEGAEFERARRVAERLIALLGAFARERRIDFKDMRDSEPLRDDPAGDRKGAVAFVYQIRRALLETAQQGMLHARVGPDVA